jgi:hypothetical protein
MDIKRAIKTIKNNCGISSTRPIGGECSEKCEYYENCLNVKCPCGWIIPTNGEKMVIEAIVSIHNYCLMNSTCEDCDFYSFCNEKAIPSFWEIEDEEIVE